MAGERADDSVRRVVRRVVRVARVLLAVPADLAQRALRPAQGGGDHDAGVAGAVHERPGHCTGVRRHRQCGACERAGDWLRVWGDCGWCAAVDQIDCGRAAHANRPEVGAPTNERTELARRSSVLTTASGRLSRWGGPVLMR